MPPRTLKLFENLPSDSESLEQEEVPSSIPKDEEQEEDLVDDQKQGVEGMEIDKGKKAVEVPVAVSNTGDADKLRSAESGGVLSSNAKYVQQQDLDDDQQEQVVATGNDYKDDYDIISNDLQHLMQQTDEETDSAKKHRIDKGKQPIMESVSKSQNQEDEHQSEWTPKWSTIFIEYWADCKDTETHAKLTRKTEMLSEALLSIPEVKVVDTNPETPLNIGIYNGLFRVRTEDGYVLLDYQEKTQSRINEVLRLNTYKFMLEVKDKVDKGKPRPLPTSETSTEQ